MILKALYFQRIVSQSDKLVNYGGQSKNKNHSSVIRYWLAVIMKEGINYILT